MTWFILAQIFSLLLSLVSINRLSDEEKALEILILRQQLAITKRKKKTPFRPSQAERITLAILTAKLKKVTGRSAAQLRGIIRIVQPETVLRWHRELVRRKWRYPRQNKGGRPRTKREMERLIVRFARENSGWGYGKIQGELLKLGFETSETSISNILRKHNIPPVPARKASIGWRHLMNHYNLDHLLVINEAHLRRVLKTFIDYYNQSRPHQGLEQRMPIPSQQPIVTTGPVQRNKVLGFISDYYHGLEPGVICSA